MANTSSILLVSAVVALLVGGTVGYYARGSELSTLQGNLAKAADSKTMLEEELKAAQADATKAKEGKAMLEAELKSKTVPLTGNIPESEFVADENGNGLYWIVLDKDPRAAFEKIIILYLPNMQMDQAVLTATASFS